MRLCVSNIAWKADEAGAAAALLAGRGVRFVEAAPTLLLPSGYAAAPEEAAQVKAWWEARGLGIGAFQALLFGLPELTLFGDEAGRAALAAHLQRVAGLAGQLAALPNDRPGPTPLVFGSPRNRLRGALSEAEALAVVAPFLHRLGERLAPHGACLCLEPLGEAWGCDFARTLREAADIARAADHPAIGVNVDLGSLTSGHEEARAALAHAAPFVRHVHVSEPGLAPVPAPGTNHAAFAAALRDSGWDGLVSIEMRRAEDDPLGAVARAVDFVAETYLGGRA